MVNVIYLLSKNLNVDLKAENLQLFPVNMYEHLDSWDLYKFDRKKGKIAQHS